MHIPQEVGFIVDICTGGAFEVEACRGTTVNREF